MPERLQRRPEFTEQQAQSIASNFFGIEGVATELPGERDQNFRVLTNNDCYVLKLANLDTQFEYLEFENQAIRLCQTIDDLATPILVKSNSNESIVSIPFDQPNSEVTQQCFARCLTFLSGVPLAACKNLTPKLFSAIGRSLAAVDKKLQLLNHSKAARRKLKWDLAVANDVILKNIQFIENNDRKQLVQNFLSRHESVAGTIRELEKSVIHNDPNDLNWILDIDSMDSASRIGLIDFGDSVYSTTVNDLAICCAYLILGREKPFEIATHVIQGYHQNRPLVDAELSVLFSLICMRLCQSVAISAEQKRLRPNDPNLTVSETPAWQMLENLASVSPSDVQEHFFDACYSAISMPLESLDRQEQILQDRSKLLAPSLSLSYQRPLNIVRGKGQYLYSENGATFLDCVNNVCHVGHCHPLVSQAIANQAALLNTNTRYLHTNIVELARRLTSKMPEPLQVCFFVNSGSEANDLALRLAMNYTGRSQFIVVDHAYHGHTKSLIEISPYKFNGSGGLGCAENVHVLPMPDGFRGKYKYAQRDLGVSYAQDAVRSIASLADAGNTPAAFIAESMLSCAGQIVLPDGYLKPIYDSVRSHGGVCVADEVQVGLGRVGKSYWGFQLQDVVPDIVTVGKPFGNGHPLAAVVTTSEIAAAFNNGMEYFNTFGGNPVSCAAGLAVLEVIDNEKLQEHALAVGTELKRQLVELKEQFPERLGDVRGEGLFIGLEFVTDLKTNKPDAEFANRVVESMKSKNILLSTDGPNRNVIKIKPPIIFDHSNAQRLAATLERVIRSLVAKK